MSVIVYTFGLCHCSVCVPKDMPRDEVERGANTAHPTGVTPWKISDEPTFKAGEPNPCQCEGDSTRQHYLMVC
jgi:hypothetical protein